MEGRRSACGEKCKDWSLVVRAQEEENENAELEAENQEGKLAWQGGRTEEATYEAGDNEDAAAAAAARAQAARQAGDVMVTN